MHEEWAARGDAGAAVREGLARTGGVITAAAAVMVAVFGAFAISGTRVLAMFGLAMASAVFLDAIVIRMAPAARRAPAARPHHMGAAAMARPKAPASRNRGRAHRAGAAEAGARTGDRVMTDERTLDRLIAHLRAHVADLAKLAHTAGLRRQMSNR